jgi:hypothetical protein
MADPPLTLTVNSSNQPAPYPLKKVEKERLSQSSALLIFARASGKLPKKSADPNVMSNTSISPLREREWDENVFN